MNPMQSVRIEKVTLNIGAGKEQTKVERGVMLIKHITGITPIKTITSKRIPSWGLRPGLPIGCKLTLRNKHAKELLGRLLKAKENKLLSSQFDQCGNISFGIPEYIDIPGVKYEPKIGVAGFEVCVTLGKPGHRVKRRKICKKKVGKNQLVTKSQAINFVKTEYDTTVIGETA